MTTRVRRRGHAVAMADSTEPTRAPESTDADAGDTGGTEVAPAKESRHRGRRIATVVLVILGCVLAPVSVLALWAKTTLLDTDQYVETVAPLATNQDIID